MSAPTHTDLAALLGRDVSQGQGEAVIAIVSAMVSSRTRGKGFSEDGPAPDLRAAIMTASARLLSNAGGLLMDETQGPTSVSYRSAFQGFTVGETLVIQRYRRMAR